jgi:hypothetical protein
MRLARLVAAGLVLGAVIGFVTALVRSRGLHPVSTAHGDPPGQSTVDLPPAGTSFTRHFSTGHSSTGPGSAGPHPAHVSASEQVGPAGAGADLPTRPVPLPTSPALSGTGGSR